LQYKYYLRQGREKVGRESGRGRERIWSRLKKKVF
jgi:hypothetical protein